MDQSIPRMLKYSQIKPKGIPTKMKRVEINQLNNQSQLNFNDIIRFQFQTDQFIDPFSAYIEIQVEVPQSVENMPNVTALNMFNAVKTNVTDAFDSTQIDTQVQYFQDFQNIPLYILDGPATSLISEMVFYSNGREVERINEYDQLGHLISDMGIDQLTRSKSGYYGLASSFGKSDYSYLTHQMQNNSQQNNTIIQPTLKNHSLTSKNESELMFQSQNQGGGITFYSGVNQHLQTATSSIISNATGSTPNAYQYLIHNTPVQYKSPINDYLDISITSCLTAPNYYEQFLNSTDQVARLQYEFGASTQHNYIKNHIDKYNKYPGLFPISNRLSYFDALNGNTNSSIIYSKQQALLPKQYINYAREFALQDGQYGVEHYDTVSITPYMTNKSQGRPLGFTFNQSGLLNDQSSNLYAGDLASEIQRNNTDTIPYQQNNTIKRRKRILYNNASNQNNFTYFAPGIAQQRWKDGKPVTDYNIGGTSLSNTNKELKYGVTKKTFYVPLLSGILGHLIPNEQWKLIPGKGCGLMSWEFRLNRHAIFMSGHKKNDGTFDQVTANDQFHGGNTARNGWNIKKISMHFDVWDFEPSIYQMVDEQLKDGIIMNSQAFVNGPTYSIANTSQLKGSWQINNSVQSVKNIYFWFLLDDYMKYNFCRKQFRISHNLKSMQFKLGTEFIPEQPLVGHAGNLIEFNDETTRDVTPFYTELLRTQGEFLSTKGKCQILPQNFIVNERSYNVDDQSQSQFQTAFLHETRLCGKALYTINLEPDQFDYQFLSGKNISQVRPVEILLDTHTNGQQTRPSTMYVLIHADSIVSFTESGIQVAI